MTEKGIPVGRRALDRSQSDDECDIMIGALRIELDGIRVSYTQPGARDQSVALVDERKT